MNEDQQQRRMPELRPVPWTARKLVADFEELTKMSETDIKRYSGERGA